MQIIHGINKRKAECVDEWKPTPYSSQTVTRFTRSQSIRGGRKGGREEGRATKTPYNFRDRKILKSIP